MRSLRVAALFAALASLALMTIPTASTHPNHRYFVDPTAKLIRPGNIDFGDKVYVAPFATLKAGKGGGPYAILLFDGSDVQDNVLIDATNGQVAIGENTIIAHGATVKSSSVGIHGICGSPIICASFVSFNAEVEGAIIEVDAMVSALSRVGPGVTIPSGFKTIPGKNIETQEEVSTETEPVTDADREFMSGVVEVNEAFSGSYRKLEKLKATNVRGINYDPGKVEFNEERDLPTLAGKKTRAPKFRNRIIGDVTLTDSKRALSQKIGNMISLRADEGEPFTVGSVLCMGNRTTFHALEHTHLELGDLGCYGNHSIVHGGPTGFENRTITGDEFALGPYSVFYKSRAGNSVTIGYKSLVQGSDLADGTVVPARTIMIDNVIIGTVEW